VPDRAGIAEVPQIASGATRRVAASRLGGGGWASSPITSTGRAGREAFPSGVPGRDHHTGKVHKNDGLSVCPYVNLQLLGPVAPLQDSSPLDWVTTGGGITQEESWLCADGSA